MANWIQIRKTMATVVLENEEVIIETANALPNTYEVTVTPKGWVGAAPTGSHPFDGEIFIGRPKSKAAIRKAADRLSDLYVSDLIKK